MSEIPVGWYGVHWSAGIAFLEQGGPGSNAAGVDIASPFFVRPFRRGTCPHAIDLKDTVTAEEWEAVLPLLSDPLVDAFMPVPREENRIFFFDDRHRALIAPLLRMANPTQPLIYPVWARTADTYVSNVAPLVLTDVAPRYGRFVQQAIDLARTGVRTTILTGQSDVILGPDVERRRSGLTPEQLRDHPWERVGAALLRRHMRNQPLLSGPTKSPTSPS